MDLQEKLIWGQFLPIATGCLFGALYVVREHRGSKPLPLVGSMALIVLMQVVYFIVVAATSRKEPRDERTRLIEFKGYKVAYLMTLVAVFLWIGALMGGKAPEAETTTFLVILVFGVEAVRTGTQLALYRLRVRV